jgi:sterol desaturase/sphingolipid hydroxylase (fatty acid hydroxylase superfamily)
VEGHVLDEAGRLLYSAADSLRIAVELLVWSTVAFGSLALLVKGKEALSAAGRAANEIRLNLSLRFLDAVFVAPVVAVAVAVLRAGLTEYSLVLIDAETWQMLPQLAVFAAVVFVGDFISYWRHRLEHTRWLWPTHAIHHSDAEMTWLTLARFHPLNRLFTMVVDVGVLALLGFPQWALVANVILRHYYGEFIHADLPWTYGPVRWLFVSPVMHRWHHARDVTGAGSNFATVLSIFDQAFGTYYVPGICNVPLGVTDEMGKGTIGQLAYPFVAWARQVAETRSSRPRSAQRDLEQV